MFFSQKEKKNSSFGVNDKEIKALRMLLRCAGYIVARQEVTFCEYKQENNLLLSL
jgi:hypothetical protein